MGAPAKSPAVPGRSACRIGPSFSLVAAVSTDKAAQSLLRSDPVQRIDLARTFFTCTVAKRAARHLQSPKSTRLPWIVACFWISQCSVACAPFLQRGPHASIVTCVVPCVATLLSLPALILMAGNLSVDVIHILLNENEFWCGVILNTTLWVVIAISFGLDWRVCLCLVEWCVVQLALAGDADFRRCGRRLHLRFAACLQTALYFCYSLSGVLERSFQPIFTISDRPSSANDLITWTAPSLLALLLRGVYLQTQSRKRAKQRTAGKGSDLTTVVIYCSTISVRLALGKAMDLDPPRQLDSTVGEGPVGIPLVRSKTLPAYVDVTETFASTASALAEDRIRGATFVLLYSTGVISFTATCIATFLSQIHAVTHPDLYVAPLLAAGALVGTAIFCGLTARFYHRGILRELSRTFDVVFASIPMLSGGLLLCELARWDVRCINVLTWAVWFHWVLCLDALTPPIRAYLRLKKLTATPVALFMLYAFGGPFVVLYGYSNTKLYDYVVVAHLRLSTLVLTRVLTLWIWCAHLVWDVGVRDDNEFIFLRDLVEYSVPREALLVPGPTTSGNAVVPKESIIPTPLQSPTPPVALSTPAPTTPSSSPAPH